ncbi:hypothetical protein PoB_006399500 [Plakobranchus ocellatus]|uniref:C-type lectin domain-containing protein n=1 Tax=Plakobranchus ocellatus TaxID=259542 RepID=A0AAV4D098_9GAST|nr:hypothetical protein PoB_006399500 [Plakobranchus ocellatus]
MMSRVQSLVAQVSLLCYVMTNVLPSSKADYASGEVTLTLTEDKLNSGEANHACAKILNGALSMLRATENYTGTAWQGKNYGDSWISLQWMKVAESVGPRTMKNGLKWERKHCQEDENSVICETTKFLYNGFYVEDSTTGMVTRILESGDGCHGLCDKVYGCYKTLPLGNSFCILDLVLESKSDDNTKPFVVNGEYLLKYNTAR